MVYTLVNCTVIVTFNTYMPFLLINNKQRHLNSRFKSIILLLHICKWPLIFTIKVVLKCGGEKKKFLKYKCRRDVEEMKLNVHVCERTITSNTKITMISCFIHIVYILCYPWPFFSLSEHLKVSLCQHPYHPHYCASINSTLILIAHNVSSA